MTTLFYLVPVAAVIALLFAWIFFRQMMKESEGTPTMKEIAQYVREGAMAYLKQQYKVVIIVFIVLAALFACWPMALGCRTLGCRLPSLRAASSAAWPASWA